MPLESRLHIVHIGCGVAKESVVAATEIVEPIVAIPVGDEAIFGALAIAGKANLALTTLAGERVILVSAKLYLPWTLQHLH